MSNYQEAPSKNNGEGASESSPEQSPLLTRRAALFSTVGLGLAASGVFVATRENWRAGLADVGLGDLADLQAKLESNRADFAAQYVKNGEISGDLVQVNELFVEAEWVQYLRHEPSQAVSSVAEFRAVYFDPFIDGLRAHEESIRGDKSINVEIEQEAQRLGTPTVAAMLYLKLAIDAQMGEEMHYFARRNLIVDPIMHGDRQCRSGTKLFVHEALERISSHLKEGESLVEVHTDQHVQPGLLTSDGKLITFEMTKRGYALREYGSLDKVTVKMEVVDAAHSLAQSALGQRLHTDKTIIFSNLSLEDRSGGLDIAVPGIRANGDQYGFASGKVVIPTERVPMHAVNSLAGDTGTPNDVYDTMLPSDEGKELLRKLSPADQNQFLEYSQHRPYLDSVWTQHVSIINPVLEHPARYTEREIEAKAEELSDLHLKFVDYCRKNDLVEKRSQTKSMLKQYGLGFSDGMGPLYIEQALIQNTNVMVSRWRAAHDE